MNAIGGYFELADYELGKGFPHSEGILLNTGRNALEYILRTINVVKVIFLPFYTCEVVLEPLRKLNIPWRFYHIDSLFEMAEDITPKNGEYIIANNYFGIKDSYIRSLAKKYGNHLIVDCAQAFFAKPILGIKSFYSTRKYLGVADGGVVYGAETDNSLLLEEDVSSLHNSHLFIRKVHGAEAGFQEYQLNEAKLNNQPIRRMCNDTLDRLRHIDYEKVIDRRRKNYTYLHDALKDVNCLRLPDIASFSCPMVYPFLSGIDKNLRKKLIENKIFVAKYWPSVSWVSGYDTEYNLSERVIAIPCDQRYGKQEMERIINCILR